ncbi:VOC family protein [Plantibacter sp. Mn2098]|uniref:VOC family protein n=1 Tax=Plantibacter sp. Mn2098 TaxID=3395266 RepID=UPI003BE72546
MRVRATYVEVPVLDMERAQAFYRDVFEVDVRRTVIDGHNACVIDDDDAGASDGAVIALMLGESYVPSVDGTRVYITVTSVERTLSRAVAHGGAELYPVTVADDGLVVAEFRDSEGNRAALSNR